MQVNLCIQRIIFNLNLRKFIVCTCQFLLIFFFYLGAFLCSNGFLKVVTEYHLVEDKSPKNCHAYCENSTECIYAFPSHV